jgi:SAM-dependent methyltransferase
MSQDEREWMAMQTLKELFERRETNVSTNIAPEDGMYAGNKDHYFHVGQSALQSIRLALLASGKGQLKRLLDFPCGHGRVLRMIRAAFPEAELTACDILRDGVDFCAREFNAVPVYSEDDPAKISISGPFDLIWCGSLLTHLDAGRWMDFINVFDSLLSSDGLMVLTTHGRWVAERMHRGENSYGLEPGELRRLLASYDRQGFGFGSYFHDANYGISAASPAWVCRKLEEVSNLRLIHLTERGWDSHQDVVVCMKRS